MMRKRESRRAEQFTMTKAQFKQAVESQLARFKILNAWTEANPTRVDPEVAEEIAAVAELYERLPAELRTRPLDESGYLALRANLAVVDRAAA